LLPWKTDNLQNEKENAVRRRLILIAVTWAAVVGLVAGSANAQSPTPPGGQFVLVGVVLMEGGRGLAWVQEPAFTGNKVVTVRLGDSVGPYRVTKILTHQVELAGPGGTISVPLAGSPGGVSVASSAGTSSSGTVQRPAGEMPPHPALNNPNATVIPRGDPRRNFPASMIPGGAGAVVGGVASQAQQPQASQPRAASARDVPVPAAAQTPPPEMPAHPALNNPNAIVIPRGDPRRNFPTSKMFIGG
jgi:hypothetical protein